VEELLDGDACGAASSPDSVAGSCCGVRAAQGSAALLLLVSSISACSRSHSRATGESGASDHSTLLCERDGRT
jgi:hypothetical protein